MLERESWLCIFLQDDFFLVDLIKKMGYDGEITVYDLATIFHEKKKKKNTMADKYKQHAIATKNVHA